MRASLCETAASLCLLRRANPPSPFEALNKQKCGGDTSVNLLPLGKVSPHVSALQPRCVSGMEKFKRGLSERANKGSGPSRTHL